MRQIFFFRVSYFRKHIFFKSACHTCQRVRHNEKKHFLTFISAAVYSFFLHSSTFFAIVVVGGGMDEFKNPQAQCFFFVLFIVSRLCTAPVCTYVEETRMRVEKKICIYN